MENHDNPQRSYRSLGCGFGSDGGGEDAAAIYTLLGSAKLNGLDPELYLRRVLERIAGHPISRLQELLP
jgi:transposase